MLLVTQAPDSSGACAVSRARGWSEPSASTLDQKIAGQKQVKDAERRLKDNRKRRDEAQDEIEARKDKLIEEVEAQLRQRTEVSELFTVRWNVI